MSEIVKICKKHGNLTKDLIHPKGKSKTGKQYYGCILCKREVAMRYIANNPENVKKQAANRHQKRKLKPDFKEKKKKWMHDYYERRLIRDKEGLRAKNRREKKRYYKRHTQIILERMKNITANLHPSYVRAYLKKHYGFENPSHALIDCKSVLMLLRREIIKNNIVGGKNKYVVKTKKYPRRIQTEDAESRIIKGSTENFKKSPHPSENN